MRLIEDQEIEWSYGVRLPLNVVYIIGRCGPQELQSTSPLSNFQKQFLYDHSLRFHALTAVKMGLLYDMSVPMYISAMQSLLHILKKGETWASENNVELSKLFNARLYDDMNVRS